MADHVFETFNAMVIEPSARLSGFDTSQISRGAVLDFVPTAQQLSVLQSSTEPLPVRTLFGKRERDEGSVFDLLAKQFFHYVEVYGLDRPGLFNLEVEDGVAVSMRYVRGITVDELGVLVRNLLESNAPVKDAAALVTIVQQYKIDYDINTVANNELRVMLFDVKRDVFASGDDAVRHMVYTATDSSLLIKSPEVVEALKTNRTKISTQFLRKHADQLARVFNRHKRLIMAVKHIDNRSEINRISRWSKKLHVPVIESINKKFVTLALRDAAFDTTVLDRISLRDHFKYLNLLAFKRAGLTKDVFVIRNGKMHLSENRPVYAHSDIDRVEAAVLRSIAARLQHLRGTSILLDPAVDYGLPVSRKQTIGRLPFGTAITVDNNKISAGIYWHNDGGANDLDLSAIDQKGNRAGWGSYSTYLRQDIVYSGDVTDARAGAMEFMTSSECEYGVFVNIFNGAPNSTASLVVGYGSKNRWIESLAVREEFTLASRSNLLGFVRNNCFTVYGGRTGGDRVSSGTRDSVMISRAASPFWTVKRLLEKLDLDVNFVVDTNQCINYNLTYDQFSYDQLEQLFQL